MNKFSRLNYDMPPLVKRQEKRVPFTVTDMKAKTRDEAKAELAAWYAAREESSRIKKAAAREAAVNMVMSDKAIPTELKSGATKAFDSLEHIDRLTKGRSYIRQPEPKKSWISRTYEYLMNKFLNIEFN